MTFREMLDVLRARRKVVALVFCGMLVISAIGTLIWPTTYVAEAAIVVDSKTSDPVYGQKSTVDPLLNRVSTEVDVIASHNVAKRVVQKLHLASLSAWQDRYNAAVHPWYVLGVHPEIFTPIEDWIADKLLLKLVVTPSKSSQVILIDMGASEPQMSADLANAFADAFIQASLDLKMEPARRQSAWLTAQLKGLRANVESAQERLSTFQRSSSVVGTNDQIDIENGRLSTISTQLIAAQVAMYDAQTRLKQMNQAVQEDKLQQLPDIEGNVLLQNMKATLAVAEGRLAQVSASFGSNHPEYISAEAQVSELRRKLLGEVQTARGTINQTAAISARQEAELRQALDQQRDRILELTQQKDRLDVLKRDVNEAQQAFDGAVKRTNDTHLESQLDESNIAVLTIAAVPQTYAKPKPLLNLFLGGVLGIVFGVAAAIVAEQMNSLVRSRRDFPGLAGIDLLAEIPRFAAQGGSESEPRHRSKFFPRRRVLSLVRQEI